MTYPDTTRTIYYGLEATPKTRSGNMHFMHTMNQPVHTLQNGVIFLEENTGTRTRDNGVGRGKRGSTIRLQMYMRLQELGLILESAIAQGVQTPFPDTSHQTLTMNGVPTGGTFTMTWEGQTTTPLSYNVLGSAMQTALEALSNVAPGDLTVTGPAGGPWVIAFPLGVPGLPGVIAPGVFVVDGSLLAGGTAPHVVITFPTPVTGVSLRTYTGGSARGNYCSVEFFNGLYWRGMYGMRVNTCNIQGSGNAMAMLDVECIGPASAKVATPPVSVEDKTYKPVDVPMQAVYIAGLIDADMDRMNLNINNNLTQRPTMDGTTSMRRIRTGFFAVEVDGMADYPAYAGSFYEAMETKAGEGLGALDMICYDDLHVIGTTTPIHPYADFLMPTPLLADTTEGQDGDELVQMIKGRAENDPVAGATFVVTIATDKLTSYFDPA